MIIAQGRRLVPVRGVVFEKQWSSAVRSLPGYLHCQEVSGEGFAVRIDRV